MSEEHKPLEIALFEAIKDFSIRNDLWIGSMSGQGGTLSINIPDNNGKTVIPLIISLDKSGRIAEPIVIECNKNTSPELCKEFQDYLKTEYGINAVYEQN